MIDQALRIDNPTRTVPTTMDCVSCHTATRALARLGGVDFLNASDDNPNRYQPPTGETVTFSQLVTAGNSYDVRAFGYVGDGASITMGTVNDSARVAAFLNAQSP